MCTIEEDSVSEILGDSMGEVVGDSTNEDSEVAGSTDVKKERAEEESKGAVRSGEDVSADGPAEDDSVDESTEDDSAENDSAEGTADDDSAVGSAEYDSADDPTNGSEDDSLGCSIDVWELPT